MIDTFLVIFVDQLGLAWVWHRIQVYGDVVIHCHFICKCLLLSHLFHVGANFFPFVGQSPWLPIIIDFIFFGKIFQVDCSIFSDPQIPSCCFIQNLLLVRFVFFLFWIRSVYFFIIFILTFMLPSFLLFDRLLSLQPLFNMFIKDFYIPVVPTVSLLRPT